MCWTSYGKDFIFKIELKCTEYEMCHFSSFPVYLGVLLIPTTFSNYNYFSNVRDVIKKVPCSDMKWMMNMNRVHFQRVIYLFDWATKKNLNKFQVVWVKEISQGMIALMLTENIRKQHPFRNISEISIYGIGVITRAIHDKISGTARNEMLRHWLCPW